MVLKRVLKDIVLKCFGQSTSARQILNVYFRNFTFQIARRIDHGSYPLEILCKVYVRLKMYIPYVRKLRSRFFTVRK